jgi:4-amino-4-deoxy-L-arabinose transferase-like glycosyltransferase
MIEQTLKRWLSFPTQFFLIAIGALLFIPELGSVHLFDWDELMPAESSREMLVTGNYEMVQIDYQPFYEKPPLFFWVQAASMKYFGVNELGARFPNAIIGILTMLALFAIGRNVFKSQLGVLWALLFAGAILPQFYFRSGFMHPLYDLLTFLSVFYLFKITAINDFEPRKVQHIKRWRNLFLSALFMGLASLVKGPAAIVVVVVTASVYFVLNRGKLKIGLLDIAIWWVVAMAVVFSWLGFEIYHNGYRFVEGMAGFYEKLIGTKAEGHSGPWFYHILVLLIGVFPASVLAFTGFLKNNLDDSIQLNFKRWMIYLFIVNLSIFSIAETKIVHYSSLCYFPLTFLAAYYLNYLFDKKMEWGWKQTVPLLTIGLLIVTAISGGIILMQRPDVFINYIKDDFAVECLKADVSWTRNDIFFGAAYLVCIIITLSLAQTKHVRWGTYLLLISSAVFVNTMMIRVVPRVERYSQGALIDFLKEKKTENCLVETAGFRSYAHWFYTEKPPVLPHDPARKTYVVTKINKVNEVLAQQPNLHELYRKNGWVFFVKE